MPLGAFIREIKVHDGMRSFRAVTYVRILEMGAGPSPKLKIQS